MNALTLDDIRLFRESTVAVHVSSPDLRSMQLARAETLWAEGLPRAKIAEAIGVPTTTLHGWINKHRARFQHRKGDLAPPRKTAPDGETLKIVLQMWEDGETQAAIGTRFGVSKNIVRKWMEENRALFRFRRTRKNGDVPAALLPADLQTGGMQPGQALAESKPARTEFVEGFAVPEISARPKRGEFTLMQLTAATCKWPVTTAWTSTLFCGGKVCRGSYCGKHASLAYQPRAG